MTYRMDVSPFIPNSEAALVDHLVAIVVEAVAGLFALSFLVRVEHHTQRLVATERRLDPLNFTSTHPVTERAVERDRAVEREHPTLVGVVQHRLAVDPH